MYNRYIPQPDGSFRRSRLPDQSRPPQPKPVPTVSAPVCPPPKDEGCPPPKPPAPPSKRERCGEKQDKSQAGSIGGFLRQLLPRDLDAGDLMIILLLLLMAGDQREDQNTALLTLAIYLFL